jgi:hypothetical protein
MCIGIALGVSLGAAFDSYPIGFAIGAGVGVSLAMAFSAQRRPASRSLTIVGALLLLAGVIFFAAVMSFVLPRLWCDYPILNLLPGC